MKTEVNTFGCWFAVTSEEELPAPFQHLDQMFSELGAAETVEEEVGGTVQHIQQLVHRVCHRVEVVVSETKPQNAVKKQNISL